MIAWPEWLTPKAWRPAGAASAPPAAVPARAMPAPVPVHVVGWPGEADLATILEATGCAHPTYWAPFLLPELRTRAITTPARLGLFLANTMHESAGGAVLVENLTYTSAARIRAVWPRRFATEADAAPFVRNPQALANRVYAGRNGNGGEATGDGWRFRGRGLIQITGRANYAAAAAAFGRGLDDPFIGWCSTPAGAAATACWWWAAHGCNTLADRGDDVAVRERINGGRNGLQDVQRREAAVRPVLAGMVTG